MTRMKDHNTSSTEMLFTRRNSSRSSTPLPFTALDQQFHLQKAGGQRDISLRQLQHADMRTPT
ncbi:hypothetical protein FOMPIDRAFT_1025733 [Fomitopsis schrenkii]|uniref:Uncharacterized protein n=1 Tax=Fomitopsis schrenkii TaxID=2126942 RepID=S8DWJ3_FOMSC|nr:hypothetical protein FOMPIDRAFT_1025733 [Fomitopsis schrenkii]